MTLTDTARKLVAEATPGPWTADEDCPVGHKPVVWTDANKIGERGWKGKLIARVGNMEDPAVAQDEWEANAALIAAAPTLITQLADTIEQLQAENEALAKRWSDERDRADTATQSLEAAEATLREIGEVAKPILASKVYAWTAENAAIHRAAMKRIATLAGVHHD